jgi:hypothetical protein
MTHFLRPGPLGSSGYVPMDTGTLMLTASSPPGVSRSDSAYAAQFESEIRLLQGVLATAGTFAANDSHVRNIYNQRVQAVATELRNSARAGTISWKNAAEQASMLRNTVMTTLRGHTSPIGRASAEAMKAQGKTLNSLVAKKTTELFGARANFNQLSAAQKNQVYAAVVASAGKANPTVNANMTRMGYAGRSLIFLSIAISVYNVATADDKVGAAGKEVAVTGASIAGGIAGGALAGLACGPGAPVCVTVGAFVGGALAAFGVSSLW